MRGVRKVDLLRARWDAWAHNTRNRVIGKVVRLLRLEPRCSCGWPLVQRFGDKLWICGACVNRERRESK